MCNENCDAKIKAFRCKLTECDVALNNVKELFGHCAPLYYDIENSPCCPDRWICRKCN